MDSFYASAEMARRPELAGKPVIVGADPREGKGRGVVVACNYPARDFGVHSAMPISEAWRACPQASYLRPDFEYYEALSGKVMRLIKSLGTRFEQVSIDEAFVDLSGVVGTLDDAEAWVRRLKEDMRRSTGLTCSVGLAENKSAAKIATDIHKPDGVTIIPPGETKQYLASMPVAVIPGVGTKKELVLREMGVKTVGDLQAVDVEVLRKSFGKVGVWLWEVANGIEREEVEEHEMKSLSTERTFEADTTDWELTERAARELASELARRVQEAHVTFRRVGVKIRFRGFETHTKETMLKTRSGDEGPLVKEMLALLRNFRDENKPVRLIGVRVSDFRREVTDQMPITSWMNQKNEKES
jgi:DNA polymerase IV (archaeal DinB-like DNA polymerase)